MIRTRKLTPDVYYRQSRDFQFIGRLYDMVLNSVKTNSDMIYSLPNSEDADTAFLELLSMTLGFKTLHNYNINQLKALCSCFAEIIRNKGNIQSITKACYALIGAEGINETINIDESDFKNGIVIYVPRTMSDTNLLRDLLNYILPAGMSYSIVKILRQEKALNTEVGVSSSIKIGTANPSAVSLMPTQAEIGTPGYNPTELVAPNVFSTLGMIMNSTVVDKWDTDNSILKESTKEYSFAPTEGETADEASAASVSSDETEVE